MKRKRKPVTPILRWEKPYFISKKCTCYKNKIKKKKETESDQFGISDRVGISEGKSLNYPLNDKLSNPRFLKTFHIKYQGGLSPIAKSKLSKFKNKYIYYAIDDILYFFDLKLDEKEKLQTFLYSSMISLQNDFSVNLFDIWIDSIYYNDGIRNNKFLTKNLQNHKHFTHIILKLSYIKKSPVKKAESKW